MKQDTQDRTGGLLILQVDAEIIVTFEGTTGKLRSSLSCPLKSFLKDLQLMRFWCAMIGPFVSVHEHNLFFPVSSVTLPTCSFQVSRGPYA